VAHAHWLGPKVLITVRAVAMAVQFSSEFFLFLC